MVIPVGCFGPNVSGGIPIATKSLDLEADSTQYLSMSDANFGNINQRIGAISVWIKRESAAAGYKTILSQWTSANLAASSWGLFVGASGDFGLDIVSGSTDYRAYSATGLISTGTWYHLYGTYDTTQGTASNRIQIYLNGSLLTPASSNYPAQNTDINNTSTAVAIGAMSGGQQNFDGLIFQPGVFTAVNPANSSVYSGGKVNIANLPGLMSLENPTTAVTDDDILVANWTNNNTATSSVDVPT